MVGRPSLSYLTYQEEGRVKAREKHPLHLAGCMLYWAEGTKTGGTFRFINSDPNMLLLIMRFLREEMGIENARIKIRVQCHTTKTDEIRCIEEYWLKLLNLPSSCLGKTQVKRGNPTQPHKVYRNGFCTISIRKSRLLLQHIFGAIQEYGGFDNRKWLGQIET